MKKKWLLIISATLFLAVFGITGCYYDKADQVYPSHTSCDTTNVLLSGDLNTIMAARCFSCHGGNAVSGAGIQLQDFSVLQEYVRNGKLLSSLVWDGKTINMPKGSTKLSDCEIRQFEAWINKGAPNN